MLPNRDLSEGSCYLAVDGKMKYATVLVSLSDTVDIPRSVHMEEFTTTKIQYTSDDAGSINQTGQFLKTTCG